MSALAIPCVNDHFSICFVVGWGSCREFCGGKDTKICRSAALFSVCPLRLLCDGVQCVWFVWGVGACCVIAFELLAQLLCTIVVVFGAP